GKLLATIADNDKEEAVEILREFRELGWEIYATGGTAKKLNDAGVGAAPVLKIREGTPNLLDLVRNGNIDLLINTLSTDKQTEREGVHIRRASVETGVTCLTSLDTARALLRSIRARKAGEAFACKTTSEYLAGVG
ncbi:MAG: carbamoyl-phosphate synthase large chain, partial [Chthonomonadales bacterium]